MLNILIYLKRVKYLFTDLNICFEDINVSIDTYDKIVSFYPLIHNLTYISGYIFDEMVAIMFSLLIISHKQTFNTKRNLFLCTTHHEGRKRKMGEEATILRR